MAMTLQSTARSMMQRGSQRAVQRFIGVVAVIACLATLTSLSSPKADADVGELGPPPSTDEAKAALTWLYNNGQPPDTTIDVDFPGTVMIGAKPTMHPNPPPDPWCVRCGYPDQGSSLMYPVIALVTVTSTQGLASSSLPESSFRHVVTTSYNGTPCNGEQRAEYCPAYYFYRDPDGRWRIAA
jgi:hypothetical protein